MLGSTIKITSSLSNELVIGNFPIVHFSLMLVKMTADTEHHLQPFHLWLAKLPQ